MDIPLEFETPIRGQVLYVNHSLGLDIQELYHLLNWINSPEGFLLLSNCHFRSSTLPNQIIINGIKYHLNIKGAHPDNLHVLANVRDGSIKMIGLENLDRATDLVAKSERLSKIHGLVTEIPVVVFRPDNIPFQGENYDNKVVASKVPVIDTYDSFLKVGDKEAKAERLTAIQSFIDTTEFAIVLRLLPCPYRVEDIENFADSGDRELIEEIIKGLSEQVSDIDGFFSEVFATNLGTQLGLLHKNNILHNTVSGHNITLMGYIVDLNTVEFDYTVTNFHFNKFKTGFQRAKKVITRLIQKLETHGIIKTETGVMILNNFTSAYNKQTVSEG